MCFCAAMVACISMSFGPIRLVNLGWIADNIVAELAAMMVISIALSAWLYDSSFRGKHKLLAEGGSSGELTVFPTCPERALGCSSHLVKVNWLMLSV